MLVLGGEDSYGNDTADVYMYNADSDSWLGLGNMPTARSWCLVVGLRDLIIAVGGGFSGCCTVEVGYLQLSGGCRIIITESVDSICRDSADMLILQISQNLQKRLTFKQYNNLIS